MYMTQPLSICIIARPKPWLFGEHWGVRLPDGRVIHLTPNGVAYVSYNVFPGWHMRGVVRDMMRFHSRKLSDPSRQAQHSQRQMRSAPQ